MKTIILVVLLALFACVFATQVEVEALESAVVNSDADRTAAVAPVDPKRAQLKAAIKDVLLGALQKKVNEQRPARRERQSTKPARRESRRPARRESRKSSGRGSRRPTRRTRRGPRRGGRRPRRCNCRRGGRRGRRCSRRGGRGRRGGRRGDRRPRRGSRRGPRRGARRGDRRQMRVASDVEGPRNDEKINKVMTRLVTKEKVRKMRPRRSTMEELVASEQRQLKKVDLLKIILDKTAKASETDDEEKKTLKKLLREFAARSMLSNTYKLKTVQNLIAKMKNFQGVKKVQKTVNKQLADAEFLGKFGKLIGDVAKKVGKNALDAAKRSALGSIGLGGL